MPRSCHERYACVCIRAVPALMCVCHDTQIPTLTLDYVYSTLHRTHSTLVGVMISWYDTHDIFSPGPAYEYEERLM